MYTQFNRSLIYLLAGSALSVFEELPGRSFPSSSVIGSSHKSVPLFGLLWRTVPSIGCSQLHHGDGHVGRRRLDGDRWPADRVDGDAPRVSYSTGDARAERHLRHPDV